MFAGMFPLVILALIFVTSCIKIINEYERAVILFLGRFYETKDPGVRVVIPGIQQMFRVSLRTVVLDVPPQDVITRDNISVKVNAVVFYRVMDAKAAILNVENFNYATSQLAQTTLRSVLGQVELDDLLANRDKINQEIQRILDTHTEAWGVKVGNVEVKNVDLPVEMQRAIAAQAEAERTRRAKIIHAEGEYQASQKLSDAGAIIAKNPAALQLRYLQTLTEVATERNSTTIFPVPIDILEAFMNRARDAKS